MRALGRQGWEFWVDGMVTGSIAMYFQGLDIESNNGSCEVSASILDTYPSKVAHKLDSIQMKSIVIRDPVLYIT